MAEGLIGLVAAGLIGSKQPSSLHSRSFQAPFRILHFRLGGAARVKTGLPRLGLLSEKGLHRLWI